MKRGDLVAIMDKAHAGDGDWGRWGFICRIETFVDRGVLVSVHVPATSRTGWFYQWQLTSIAQEDDHAAG